MIPVSSPENKSKVKEWEEEIQDLQKEICLEQHELYRCEAFLLSELETDVRRLTERPTWYCRPELVKDCAERGGCCGLSCRCCLKRHLTTQRTKGIGHCTIDAAVRKCVVLILPPKREQQSMRCLKRCFVPPIRPIL
ncbi:hypothetical protein N7497_008905 [Penicillium chrysogenum]|nr:hypothetical protein N7497_008905 [Penicillium chrysogenum]